MRKFLGFFHVRPDGSDASRVWIMTVPEYVLFVQGRPPVNELRIVRRDGDEVHVTSLISDAWAVCDQCGRIMQDIEAVYWAHDLGRLYCHACGLAHLVPNQVAESFVSVLPEMPASGRNVRARPQGPQV